MMRKKINEPNFFIVGAAKSGTTSLVHYLSQHPDVYIPSYKEPNYFSATGIFRDFDEYISLFGKAGNATAIGEASTSYLYDEHATHNIHDRYPDTKIIVILRNPVGMAFSMWRYMLIYGSEAKSFEEAVEDTEREYRKSEQFKKSCGGWWNAYLYLERGMYFNQVKRYLDVFGGGHVKVYIFEKFIKEPEKTCQDIFAFLGVNSSFVPDCKKVVNEGGEARSNFLKNVTNSRYPILRALISSRKIRAQIRHIVQMLNVKRGQKAVMKAATRIALEEFFREDIKNLESLLGYNIPEWMPKSI